VWHTFKHKIGILLIPPTTANINTNSAKCGSGAT
jgi:hypothetical protein